MLVTQRTRRSSLLSWNQRDLQARPRLQQSHNQR